MAEKMPTKSEYAVLRDYQRYFAYYNPERLGFVYAYRSERGHIDAGDDAYKPGPKIQAAISSCLENGWIEVGYMRKVTASGRAAAERAKSAGGDCQGEQIPG